MKKILAIQANALNSINAITDTTLLLAREAQKGPTTFIGIKLKT